MTLFDERPIRPMLAKTGEPFDSNNFLFEPKWDGLRLLLFKSGDKLELQNRNLRDVTRGYPELQGLSRNLRARTAILDGEAVVLSKTGTPDFHQMQNRFGIDDLRRAEFLRKSIPVTYVAFDLLHLNSKDLVSQRLEERKGLLKSIILEGPHLLYGDHVKHYGVRFYQEVLKRGFEGVIGKELDSQYLPGTRGSSWVKVKGSKTIDCVVVGFTAGEGARASTFGSLVLAAYDTKGNLQHLGNVGGGFDNKTLLVMMKKLANLPRKKPVLEGPINVPSPVTWVRPEIVCEVRYMSITTDKKLRFPRFSRLRTEKEPSECRLDPDLNGP